MKRVVCAYCRKASRVVWWGENYVTLYQSPRFASVFLHYECMLEIRQNYRAFMQDHLEDPIHWEHPLIDSLTKPKR